MWNLQKTVSSSGYLGTFRCLWQSITITVWIIWVRRQTPDWLQWRSSCFISQTKVNSDHVSAYPVPCVFRLSLKVTYAWCCTSIAFYSRETGGTEQRLTPHNLRGWAGLYGNHWLPYFQHFLNIHNSKAKARFRSLWVFICGSQWWTAMTERAPTLSMLAWRTQHTSPKSTEATLQFH